MRNAAGFVIVLKTICLFDCRCLDECHYDLKEALKLFVDLYKKDKIPDEAFDVSKT